MNLLSYVMKKKSRLHKKKLDQEEVIDAIMETLYEIWMRYPHLRLGQLLYQVLPPGSEPEYFVENHQWLRYLQHHLRRIEEAEGGDQIQKEEESFF